MPNVFQTSTVKTVRVEVYPVSVRHGSPAVVYATHNVIDIKAEVFQSFFPADAGQSPLIGNNIARIQFSPTEIFFIDLIKQSEPWNDDSDPKDDHRWPLTLAGSINSRICNSIDGRYPGGDYVCLYDGDGSLTFDRDATPGSSSSGRLEVSITPTNLGFRLILNSTTEGNHLRNVRLIPAEYEGNDAYLTQTFHPDFLERWKRMSVLRTMNWQRTSGNPIKHWDDRITLENARFWGEGGVAIENLVKLHNMLGANPWLCMHHLWQNEDVRQFAEFVRDNLRDDLNIYIEYSNECWNGSFQQAIYCRDMGEHLGLSGSRTVAGRRFYSQRSVEIFDIWEDVFGGTSRLIRVLGAQNASPTSGTDIMDWQSASDSADALAVAPYVGGSFGQESMESQVETWDLDRLFDEMELAIDSVYADTQEHFDNADSRGLILTAYEGGQHLNGVGAVEDNAAINALFDAANRDDRMRHFYMLMLERWKSIGGDVFVHFETMSEYDNEGRWGAMEYHDEEFRDLSLSTPKYQALNYYALGYSVQDAIVDIQVEAFDVPFEAGFSTNRTSAVAPMFVKCNSWGQLTTIHSDRQAFHEYHYDWDFGDPTSGTFDTTGNPKNTTRGPIVAHCYEEPGTYTITQTVRRRLADGTIETATATSTITVTDPETVFTSTYVLADADVSTDAEWVGEPAGATRVQITDWSDVVAEIAAGRRLLVRAGETLTGSQQDINVSGPGMIGTFNSSGQINVGRFTVTVPTGVDGVINIGNSDDWRVVNVDFDGTSAGANTIVMDYTGTAYSEFLLLRCDFDSLTMANMAFADPDAGPLGVFDCTSNELAEGQISSSGGMGFFIMIDNLAFVGNLLEHVVDEGEHNFRSQWLRNSVVSNSIFRGANSGNHMITVRGPNFAAGQGNLDPGVYTERNCFTDIEVDGRDSNTAGPVQVESSADSGTTQGIRDIIFDGLWCRRRNSSGVGYIRVSQERITIRNFIIHNATNSNGHGIQAFEGQRAELPTHEVNIYNGVVYYAGTNNCTGVFTENANITDTIIRNIVVIAPNITNANILSDSGTGTVDSNNYLSDSNSGQAIESLIASSTPNVPTDFETIPGSDLIDAGFVVPVFKDWRGTYFRPQGATYDIGPFEGPKVLQDAVIDIIVEAFDAVDITAVDILVEAFDATVSGPAVQDAVVNIPVETFTHHTAAVQDAIINIPVEAIDALVGVIQDTIVDVPVEVLSHHTPAVQDAVVNIPVETFTHHTPAVQDAVINIPVEAIDADVPNAVFQDAIVDISVEVLTLTQTGTINIPVEAFDAVILGMAFLYEIPVQTFDARTGVGTRVTIIDIPVEAIDGALGTSVTQDAIVDVPVEVLGARTPGKAVVATLAVEAFVGVAAPTFVVGTNPVHERASPEVTYERAW